MIGFKKNEFEKTSEKYELGGGVGYEIGFEKIGARGSVMRFLISKFEFEKSAKF